MIVHFDAEIVSDLASGKTFTQHLFDALPCFLAQDDPHSFCTFSVLESTISTSRLDLEEKDLVVSKKF